MRGILLVRRSCRPRHSSTRGRRGIFSVAAITLLGVLANALWVRGEGRQGNRDNSADPSTLVGQPAPDLNLPTLDGGSVKLVDLKGSVVVLDFWATWCPPCRASLPHVQKLNQDKELADRGLKVLAINDREDKETVQAFIRENHYDFAVPLDQDGMARHAYHVQGIPTIVIVGRDGKVRKVFVGVWAAAEKEMDDEVAAALKEKSASDVK